MTFSRTENKLSISSEKKINLQLGFNEADTFKFSSILINSHKAKGIYTQNKWHDAVIIKTEN